MTQDEVLTGLAKLGIDQQSHRALALLPLVQVAWADGRIQRAERAIILRVAKENGYLEGNAAELLETWLKKRPTETYFDRARTLLIALARLPDTGFEGSLTITTLTDLVDLCEELARAAGGLFGIFPMDVREKAAIKEICDAIALPPSESLRLEGWGDLA